MDHGSVLFTSGGGTNFVSKVFLNSIERQDLGRLYNFLQLAQEFAKSSQQSQRKINELASAWHKFSDAPMRELEVTSEDDEIIAAAKRMARLKILHGFQICWVDEFFVAILTASQPHVFETFDETLQYARGISDGVGKMIACILNIPKESHDSAASQALAMLWLQMLHDINRGTADYFPRQDLAMNNLEDLSSETAAENPEDFANFVHQQLGRYYEWQLEASAGWVELTRRQRALLHGAVDHNNRIARRIAKDPMVLFSDSLRPNPRKVILSAAGHMFD